MYALVLYVFVTLWLCMILSKGEKLIWLFFFFCTIGSGFKSLKAYGSGFFGMRTKLPNKDTTESSQPST